MFRGIWDSLFGGRKQELTPLNLPSPPRSTPTKATVRTTPTTSAKAKPPPPDTPLKGGRYQVQGSWKTAYVSASGDIIKIGSSLDDAGGGQWAQVNLLIESDVDEYLKFTQCQVSDAVSGKPSDLNPVQKHAMVKYLSNAYDWELHWQRAPSTLKSLFAYSETPKPCGDSHEWDGCLCKKCGQVRPHKWGPVKEHDFSGIGVFDGRGTVKLVFAKTCAHCNKEETVRTEYEQ